MTANVFRILYAILQKVSQIILMQEIVSFNVPVLGEEAEVEK
jgi:hypothetical protein